MTAKDKATPSKNLLFNWFYKFCFDRDLYMYKNSQNLNPCQNKIKKRKKLLDIKLKQISDFELEMDLSQDFAI